MIDNVFIDSNLWIYTFIESEKTHEKRQIIIKLLERLAQQARIVVSIQVVNETHWTLQRKYHIEEKRICEYISGMVAIAEILPLTLVDYQKAQNLRMDYEFSFWDSLIVAVALRANCNLLYSEDMHHGLTVESLVIQNPLDK
jgi:predicted nucleic acid-binding protein